MLIGRQKEREVIARLLNRKGVSVLVYGKRKVGKTTLIVESLKESKDVTVYYECLRSSLRDNLDGFVSVLVGCGILPVKINFDTFIDVFKYLNSLGKTFNIVIDEYPYLKQFEKSETVDSIFQSVIDNCLSNLRLFVSGSHVGMMKEMLRENNALYGRFTSIVKLSELDYKDAAAFYPNKSVYDKIALYSVFGGSPFVCGFIDEGLSLKDNIVETVLNDTSAIYNYAEHLLISDFSGSINAERILGVAANGRKKYGAIEEKLGMQSNGLLSKQLKTLLDMDILTKTNPINRPDDKKKTSYEISDNLLRFYYAYVYGNKSALRTLGANAFYDAYIAPSIKTFIAHRFEDICREYFAICAKSGKRTDILNVGTYYYDDSERKINGEFDVVVQMKDAYDFYEVKYTSAPLSVNAMEKERAQVFAAGLPIGRFGFISVSGFERVPDGYDCISGEQLYE